MNTTTYGLKKNDPSPQCAAIMLKLLKKKHPDIVTCYGSKCAVWTVVTHLCGKK